MAAAGPVMAQWLVVEHVVPGAVPVQDAAKRARGPAAAPAPRQRRDKVMGQRLQPPLHHDIRIRLEDDNTEHYDWCAAACRASATAG